MPVWMWCQANGAHSVLMLWYEAQKGSDNSTWGICVKGTHPDVALTLFGARGPVPSEAGPSR